MIKNITYHTLTMLLVFFSLIASAMEGQRPETYIGGENSYFWDIDLQKIQDFSNVNYRFVNNIEDGIFKNIIANTIKEFKDSNNEDIINILMRAVGFHNKFYPFVNYENVMRELTRDLREAGVYEFDLIESFLTRVFYHKTKKPQAKLASKDAYQAFEKLRYEPITITQAHQDLFEAMHVARR